MLQSSFSRLEASPVPHGTAAQKAELTALIHALELGKNLRVNTYTNSKYGFLVLHTHAAIRKEGGTFNCRKFPINNGPEILRLLEAVTLPRGGAVLHCKGYRKDAVDISWGNSLADKAAKKTATESSAPMMAILPQAISLPNRPRYTIHNITQSRSKQTIGLMLSGTGAAISLGPMGRICLP